MPASCAPAVDVTAVLAKELRISKTVTSWLIQRGHADLEATRRFLEPRLSQLSAPDEMLDRRAAAQRIARAIRERQRIVVFGDYDCDGITATAILTEALRGLGGEVDPLLASRFEGGYGLSDQAADKVAQLAPGLLITCDCGSSDHVSLARLRAEGIDAVVIDHHLVPEQPLPVTAFLNPHRPGCGFAYKGLASCGLALSVIAAVRKELGVALDVKRWLDLVAIGTIADVAPLDADNRALVRAGLRALAQAERPGLRALLEMMNVSRAGPLTARDVAFRIAPQLNAPGRMGAPTLALQLLLAQEESTAVRLATELAQITEARRREQDEILRQAREEIDDQGYAAEAAIVVGRPGWNHGIVGIVAGRLADDLGRPVAVVGFDDAGRGRGSVRGPNGVRLYDALQQAHGTLERFGGHQAAAGFELRLDDLDAFRTAFVAAIAKQRPLQVTSDASQVMVLSAEESPDAVLLDLDLLEPCWCDNPRPELEVRGRVVDARQVGDGHLKLRLDLGRFTLDCFGVNLGHNAGELCGYVTVRGDLRRNTFRGVTRAELFTHHLIAD